MKKQNSGKVLIFIASTALVITGFSNSALAQSASLRAVSRSNAAQTTASQVRRDANSINCRPSLNRHMIKYGMDYTHSHRYQTDCLHHNWNWTRH